MTPEKRIDPRIQRTRRAIQDAFQTLLSERGLMPLTVRDIAAHAGVNRVTFYAHYRDKHDLFNQVIREHLDATLAQQLVRPLGFDVQALRGLLVAVCTFMSQVHDRCHVHDDDMEVHLERQVQQRLGEWLHEALKGCQQVPNARVISRELTATLTASSLYTAAAAWSKGKADQPSEPRLGAYVSEVMVFVLGGVGGSWLVNSTELHRHDTPSAVSP